MHDWTNSNTQQPAPMNTPPSPSADWIPRHLTHNVQESLLDTRVVLVNGPRQCGKTTLVRQLGGDMRYITLDDPNMAALAQQDPVGLIRQLDRAIIDEVQRAPQLMLALKMAVDEDQRPGRFLLTGSANVLALPPSPLQGTGRASGWPRMAQALRGANMMTPMPAIAMAAPAMSHGVGRIPSTTHSQPMATKI